MIAFVISLVVAAVIIELISNAVSPQMPESYDPPEFVGGLFDSDENESLQLPRDNHHGHRHTAATCGQETSQPPQ